MRRMGNMSDFGKMDESEGKLTSERKEEKRLRQV